MRVLDLDDCLGSKVELVCIAYIFDKDFSRLHLTISTLPPTRRAFFLQVVYGHLAIAASLNLRSKIEYTAREENSVRLQLPSIKLDVTYTLR